MKRPYIIGITGGSGSGKTTFLRSLAAQFGTNQLCVLSQDEYYKPIDQQFVDQAGVCNFDLPTAFDEKAYKNDILKLINGETVTKKEYTFNNTDKIPETITFEPAPILIIEGLFVCYFKEIAALMDLKLFVDARDDLKIIRRIMRDAKERNYPLEDVLYRYEFHVTPSYEEYILPYKRTADLIINNHKSFDTALRIITAFLKGKV